MNLISIILILSLIIMMLGFTFLGIRIREYRSKKDSEDLGLKTIQNAIFALMALLVAFTFSTANGRFDTRRQLIIEESNAIGTAYLRLDVLNPEFQAQLREEFLRYLDSRLAIYKNLHDANERIIALKKSQDLQRKIWGLSIKACEMSKQPAAFRLLLPALNEMFDIANTRYVSMTIHPPLVVLILLIGVALLSSFLVGYNLDKKTIHHFLFTFSYAMLIGTIVYIIIDIEYPRYGLIRISSYDEILIDLKSSM